MDPKIKNQRKWCVIAKAKAKALINKTMISNFFYLLLELHTHTHTHSVFTFFILSLFFFFDCFMPPPRTFLMHIYVSKLISLSF